MKAQVPLTSSSIVNVNTVSFSNNLLQHTPKICQVFRRFTLLSSPGVKKDFVHMPILKEVHNGLPLRPCLQTEQALWSGNRGWCSTDCCIRPPSLSMGGFLYFLLHQSESFLVKGWIQIGWMKMTRQTEHLMHKLHMITRIKKTGSTSICSFIH